MTHAGGVQARAIPRMLLCLVATYPLLTHAAIWLHSTQLQWLALIVLTAISIYEPLKQARPWAWLAFAGVSAALYAIVHWGGGIYALFLQPILLPTAMFVVFARTLRPGATPLITRFATVVHGPLPDDLRRYTRSVTILWSTACALLAISAASFAIFASRELWSLVTNILHYLLLAALFLVEYLYRLHKFRHLPHPTFGAYVRLLFTVPMRSL